MSRITFYALFAALSLCAVASAGARDPAVARPTFNVGGKPESRGLVFFVRVEGGVGVAAVGTAHSFDLDQLVKQQRGDFLLGHSRRRVASTTGFLVPPGRPFNAPGATLRDDYVVYSLRNRPRGVRLLDLDLSGPAAIGDRVQLFGAPSSIPSDEDDLFGRVVVVTPDRIEVDLDVPYDLRGWGGAPVLAVESRKVIGILQAYWPQGDTARVSIGPVSGLAGALDSPLDGGRGRPFARFTGQIPPRARTPSPSRAAASNVDVVPPRASLDDDRTLIHQGRIDETRIHLEIEYPNDGDVVGGSACGVFVAGRAIALQGELREFDVVLVIDTSRSTIEPTGADINGNGIVGQSYLGRIGSIFNVGSTDPGDSILAAEVAAARQLLRGFDPRSTRVALVAFAGEPPTDSRGIVFRRTPPKPAVTLEPLTNEYERIESALDGVISRDPEGSTHMAAGVDQATIELMGLRGSRSKTNSRSEKVVLFFTDGQPTLPYGPGFTADNVRAVLRAASRAGRAEIRIHSFAIGPDALEGPVAVVEMATRTDGYFTPVLHPGDLVDVVEEVSFTNLSEVALRSVTSGEFAHPFRSTADGSFAGFIKMDEGPNQVEVLARATDGIEAREVVNVTLRADAPDPHVPADLAVQRNWLLEECLRELKQVRMSAERRRAEQLRKELMIEIDKERSRARERAADQRKQLELELEDTQ